jgi:hypothetical protein
MWTDCGWTVLTALQEKDTSKYKLALAQALDGVRARAEYVKVMLIVCVIDVF